MNQTATAALLLLAAATLGACSTNTKGSWACPAEKGMACASIETLDATATAHDRGSLAVASRDATPLPGGAPARWWAANDVVGSHFVAQPRREPDQTVKVLVAGWVDEAGDYHAPSEIYAVMRRGGWWTAPNVVPLLPAQQRPREAQAAPAREESAANAPIRPASPSAAAPPVANAASTSVVATRAQPAPIDVAVSQLPAATAARAVDATPRTAPASAVLSPATKQPAAPAPVAVAPAAASASGASAPKPVATNAAATSAASQTNSKS